MGCYLFPAVSHRRTHCRIRFLPAFRAAFRPVPRAAFRPVILGVERIAIARAASLPDFRAASLVDYSLIAPSACRLFRLHTVRAAFSERPSRRSRDVVTVRQPIAHARVYRLRSPHRSTQPYRLTPSMPPLSLEMAAARPPRRMAPRGAGRESMTCQFGVDRHGSRWRPTDMPDAIHDARSRRSSWQRIPDTDMEAREAGEMLYACRTTISCDTEHAGISHFQPKLPSVRFRPVRSGSYHMLGMGMTLPRVLESWSGHRPWRLGAFLLIAGRRVGRGENRMSLEDTWHVAR